MSKRTPAILRKRRHLRLRAKVKGTAARPRLCVNRTLSHIHAQIIDDVAGKTLASASTVQSDIASQVDGGKGSAAAAIVVGKIIAERAKSAGVGKRRLRPQRRVVSRRRQRVRRRRARRRPRI